MRGLGVLEERIQGLIRSLMKGSNSCRFRLYSLYRMEHHRYFANDAERRMSVRFEACSVPCLVNTLASELQILHM